VISVLPPCQNYKASAVGSSAFHKQTTEDNKFLDSWLYQQLSKQTRPTVLNFPQSDEYRALIVLLCNIDDDLFSLS